jgi:hypothetical protein
LNLDPVFEGIVNPLEDLLEKKGEKRVQKKQDRKKRKNRSGYRAIII